jgi:shikimate kinase
MKIFLVGMPGSGKSTLGKEVAKSLGIPFIDLDHEIENKEGKTIPEIFTEQGEEHFRKLESSTLKRQSQEHESFVMATGGGAPCFHAGMEVIMKAGISIYLNVPLEELVKRNSKNTVRPLLQNGDVQEKLTALLSTREPVYKLATFMIKGDQISVKEILALLKRGPNS